MRILVAVDGVKTATALVRAITERPWPSDSSLCLVNVFKPLPFTAAPIIQERWKERVLRNLEAVAVPLRNLARETAV